MKSCRMWTKKPLARKHLFLFKHLFKVWVQKIYAAKPFAFSLPFLFRHDQNHYSNLTSKIMKMCEQILKTAPQYNSNSLNCNKKTKRRPIIASAIAVLLLNNQCQLRDSNAAKWHPCVMCSSRFCSFNAIVLTKLLQFTSNNGVDFH